MVWSQTAGQTDYDKKLHPELAIDTKPVVARAYYTSENVRLTVWTVDSVH